jgi:hypothetical protein
LSREQGLLGAALANGCMALLLAFNLYCYRLLGGRAPLQAGIADLKWGVLLPCITFMLVFVSEALWLRILWVVAGGILLGVVILNDDWARPWLRRHLRELA